MSAIAEKTALAERTYHAATVQWIARGLALGGRRNQADEFMKAYGAPERAVEVIKTGTTTSLSQLAGPAITAFADQVAAESAFFAMNTDRAFLRAPANVRLVSTTHDLTGAMVGEGKPIPVADFTLNGTVMKPVKAASIIVATKELWLDVTAAGQAFINTLLRQAVGSAVDRQMFDALTYSGMTDTNASDSDETAILAGLMTLVRAIHTRKGQRLRWVLSVGALHELMEIEDERLQLSVDGGTIFGIPATLTDALGEGELVLIDASGIAADLMDIRIDASENSALELSADPEGDATTGTGSALVSLFQTNSVGVRIIVDFGIQPLRENVMAKLTLVAA